MHCFNLSCWVYNTCSVLFPAMSCCVLMAHDTQSHGKGKHLETLMHASIGMLSRMAGTNVCL